MCSVLGFLFTVVGDLRFGVLRVESVFGSCIYRFFFKVFLFEFLGLRI